jgi:class 3 adenylate cyclase/tetratricopeptide (TPR) repeat protein
VQLCPRCGEENPDRFRLCGYCGAELAPPPPAREERRTVTIVFSDLKGSTNLGEALDPESLREVMSRYFEDQTRALRRHGGTVEKFIGDAIMAVFGLPRLHEDDALRAVRAANEMQRSLAALNQELELRWGVTLTNRTGVNTGEVVAGDAATGQRLATGDAVNVAARLEQAAPPNEILLGDLTYQLVRDAVDVETVEPLELKGKAERVPAYRLISVRGEEGVLRRQDAAFVGRETERATLIALFERARDQRRCLIGTVVGEAGVGKSRLVAETLGSIGAGGRTLRGRCLPYGEGITFWPILDIVREAVGIQPEDPVGTAMDRLRETSGDPRVAERVGAAIGFSSEPFPVSELFWGIRQFLDRVAADHPLVLVIDDIHWAESTLLDLLEHLNASLAAPVLILATARHDLLEQRPTWGDSADAARLELYRLSEAEAGQVIEHLLGDAGIADQVKRRIVTAAEGNPLFVEQLVSMLVGGGQLRMEEGRWVAAGDAADLAIPPTIQALLGSRLGQLAPNERSVIEPASVIGLEFRQAAVTELSPAPLQGDVPRLLGAMTRKHLLRENPPELSENEFRFEHILIRDAAYNALLKRTRATLHEQFVEWADRTNSEREAVEYDEILAYHLEQSYRYLAELGPLDDHGTELGRRASRRLAGAGRRAFGRGDMPAAASLLRRAGETLPPGDPDRTALLPELGETLMELGDLGAADAVLTEALTAAAAAGDAVLHARAKIIMQLVTLHAGGEGWADEAIRDAEGALDTFQAARDAAGLALANRLLWAIHGTANRNGLATQAAEQVIQHARAAGDRRLEARGASGYAVTALYGPTPVAEAIERGEALVRQIEGDRRTEAFILGALAQLRGMRGEVAEARELARRSAAMLEELGVGILSSATSIDSARIELLAGDLDAAALDLRRDYDALTLMGERFLLSTVGGMLARVEYLRDQFTEAESLARVVRELSAPDDIDAQALWRSVLAMVLARAAAIDEAIALAQEAVTLRRQADAPVLLAEALEDFGEVLRFAGRDEEARSQRQQALALYEQKGDEVSAGRLRTLLS